MKITTKLSTGVLTEHNREGHIKVTSPILNEEPIYNEVTLDTALNNELKSNLIKLHQ